MKSGILALLILVVSGSTVRAGDFEKSSGDINGLKEVISRCLGVNSDAMCTGRRLNLRDETSPHHNKWLIEKMDKIPTNDTYGDSFSYEVGEFTLGENGLVTFQVTVFSDYSRVSIYSKGSITLKPCNS